MKQFFSVLLLSTVLFSCLNSDNGTVTCKNTPPSSEATQIATYCAADSINYIKDSSGIYYHIFTEGDGATPMATSSVSFTYGAYFLNGSLLDMSSQPVTSLLSNLIDGFKIMLPKIKKGTHIKMVLPSAYCYGCLGTNGVAPNTILYFDLILTDVQ